MSGPPMAPLPHRPHEGEGIAPRQRQKYSQLLMCDGYTCKRDKILVNEWANL